MAATDVYAPSGEFTYRCMVDGSFVPETLWTTDRENVQYFAQLMSQAIGRKVEVVEAETVELEKE